MYNLLYDYQILLMQKYGGISRYFYEVIRRIPEEEFKLFFPVLNNLNYYFQDYFGKPIKEISGFKKYDRVVSLNQAYSKLLLCCKGKNIVFHPTYYNPYFLNIFKGKLVVTVHDMIHEKYPQYYAGNATIEHKRLLMERADKIIAVSETTKKDILKIYEQIDERKIEVVYHGSIPKTDVADKCKYEDKYLQNGKFVLYVGNRDRYKNFTNFAKAISHILDQDKELQLVCVGGGKLQDQEKLIFSTEGCLNRVIQVNASEGELVWLYQNAVCFVFPSKAEGFGIPILEAWKNQCPIALSDIECFKEVAGNAALYFDPDNISDIEDKISKLIYDKPLRKEYISKGETREKLFSWESCAQKHYQIYRCVSE